MKNNIKKLIENLFDDDIFNNTENIELSVGLENYYVNDIMSFCYYIKLLIKKLIIKSPELLKNAPENGSSSLDYTIFLNKNKSMVKILRIHLAFTQNNINLYLETKKDNIIIYSSDNPYINEFVNLSYNEKNNVIVVKFKNNMDFISIDDSSNISIHVRTKNAYGSSLDLNNKKMKKYIDNIRNKLTIKYNTYIPIILLNDDKITAEGKQMLQLINKF